MKLFGLYAASGDLSRATEYMNRLLGAAGNEQDKNTLVGSLSRASLKARSLSVELTGTLIERWLSEKDLGPEDPMAQDINTYLKEPPEGGDVGAMLTRLRKIKVAEPEKRTLWRKLLGEWEAFANARKAAPAEKANN